MGSRVKTSDFKFRRQQMSKMSHQRCLVFIQQNDNRIYSKSYRADRRLDDVFDGSVVSKV